MIASGKEFLDIQASMECGLTLKGVLDVTRADTNMFFKYFFCTKIL